MTKLHNRMRVDFFDNAENGQRKVSVQIIDAVEFDQVLLVDDLAAVFKRLGGVLRAVAVAYGWLVAHPRLALLCGVMAASMATMFAGMVAYYFGLSG